MNENLTEIVCVLDRSGSMETIKEDSIGGFNQFLSELSLDQLKKVAEILK